MRRLPNPGLVPTRRTRPAPRVIDRRKHSGAHRRWVLAALILPVFLCAVIGIGVYLMWHRQMSFFRPPPVGTVTAPARCFDA